MSRLLFPPPPITVSGYTSDHPYRTFSPSPSPSSSSSSTSIIILIIVIASAILISASLYLLLRFLSTRFHRTFSTHNFTKSPPQDQILSSLPLFTFAAVNKKAEAGDCAVCLSKFEPTDQLRLLPLCCHAFHADCIDTWLSSSQTCPLCRSTVTPTDDDVQSKIGDERNNSFRIQIGSVSRRQTQPAAAEGLRSYSIGSFEYVVDDGFEVPVEATHHRREISTCYPVDKQDSTQCPAIQGENLTLEVNGSQSWLRDYVDRFSSSFSSHSFRSSGRFFTGSSRRSDTVVPEDIESNNVGEEISELFLWISGV